MRASVMHTEEMAVVVVLMTAGLVTMAVMSVAEVLAGITRV